MILYQDCSSHLDSSKKQGRQEAGLIFPIYLYRKLKKIFLSATTGPISIKFCRNVPVVILYQHCSSHLDSSKNIAARERGLFSLYIYIENLKNLLVRNHWTDFNIILWKCSFGDHLPRLFKPFGFVKKHGRQGMGLLFPIYLYRKLKKTSCQKPLNRFPYNFTEMFLWWSSTKIVQAIWISQKTWPPGAGLIFPIYLYRKLKKSSCQKPLDRFQYNFVEMFLWWSSTKIVQAIWIRQKTWPPGGGASFPCISI